MTVLRHGVLVAVVASGCAGCGDEHGNAAAADAAIDASLPDAAATAVAVRARVFHSKVTLDRMEFTLDGELGTTTGDVTEWLFEFPDDASALAEPFVFEVRYEGIVIDRSAGMRCEACFPAPSAVLASVDIDMCGEPAGEVRPASVSCEFGTGSCVGDAFCVPRCQPGGPCSDGGRCGLVVAHLDPPLGRLDCVPAGTVGLGDACQQGVPGTDTGYDDCVDGGMCVEGTCRTLCRPGDSPCPEACVPFAPPLDVYGYCP